MRIIVRGKPILAALILAIVLPPLVGPRPSPSAADQQIRGYLRWRMTTWQQDELAESRRTVPDSALSLHWLEESTALDSIITDTVIVHRTWFASPIRVLPVGVVRWTAHAPGRAAQTRYFRIRGRTMYRVWPTLALFWYLRI